MKDRALSYFKSFASRDRKALAQLMTDDVSLRDWVVDITGREAVLAEMGKAFSAVSSIAVTARALYKDGSTVVAELDIALGSERLKVVDILEFDSAGRIRAIRAYKG